MCKMTAIAPGYSKEKTIEILQQFERGNTDGIGYSYVENGQFRVKKWPISLLEVLETEKNFLDHLPYNKGWTIIHLRAGTHGENAVKNTHPFVVGNICVTHNGIWSEYNIVKLALGKNAKIQGETDSEVAAHLINVAGIKRFTEEVSFGGVFFVLHKNGNLYVSKTSGALAMSRWKGKYILASDLDSREYPKQLEVVNGWHKFDKHGRFVKSQESKEFVSPGYAGLSGWGHYKGKAMKKIPSVTSTVIPGVASSSAWSFLHENFD